MLTELPQWRLAYELRIAIDRAMRSPQPRWTDAVLRLVSENPHGVRSRHVTHQLGVRRRAWLRQVVATPQAARSADEGGTHGQEASE